MNKFSLKKFLPLLIPSWMMKAWRLSEGMKGFDSVGSWKRRVLISAGYIIRVSRSLNISLNGISGLILSVTVVNLISCIGPPYPRSP